MKDYYKKLSDLVSVLVDQTKKYSETVISKKEIDDTILEIKNVSHVLGGRISEKFLELESAYYKFLSDKDHDVFLEICVDFKNELWEL